MNNEEIKYFDIHMFIEEDCKSGYSIFVKAHSVQEAIAHIIKNKLYEDITDLNNIDYIGEISLSEYISSL